MCVTLHAQTPTYDDLVFDEEEMKAAYKPLGKPNVVLKSKKGTGGMPKVPAADEIKTTEITDIILVFSETTEDAADTREESNRERWENLIATYPEFFQFSTNYKNICQCNIGGDAEALKPSQGFYIYYKVAVPKAATPPPVTPKEETKEVAKVEKKETKEVKETKKAEEPVKENKEVKKEVVKEKEKPKQKEKEEEKEDEVSTAVEGAETTTSVDIVPKKKAGFTKPKRSKDPKACRPPCYGSGDEDLHLFFKDNITLSKKQKRSIKGSVSMVKLQLNFDGSIKKAMVNGTNAQFNEIVTVAIKNMDLWNPAVKAGLTVKSEVKLTLKYDKSTKAIKPVEVMITPRPNPKCLECKSDAEIFGTD